MVTLSGHSEAITGVEWTLNPGEVATVGWDQSIILWDLELAGMIEEPRGWFLWLLTFRKRYF